MIIVYATDKDGNGIPETVGHYESLEEVRIRVGIFSDDVVLEFEEVVKES